MDFAARRRRLRAVMERSGVSVGVILHPAHLQYLTGFKAISYSRPIILVLSETEETLIVPGLEELHAAEVADVAQIRAYFEHPEKGEAGQEPVEVLKEMLRWSIGASRQLGVETRLMSYAFATSLRDQAWEIVDIGDALIQERTRKDPEELELIWAAAQLAVTGVRETIGRAEPGQPVLQIEEAGNFAIIEEAARQHPSRLIGDAIVATVPGEQAARPHLLTRNDTVPSGELIIHNRQVAVDGYRAECERTFALGTLSQQQIDILSIVVEAQQAAIDAIGPGVRCSLIDEVARAVIRRAGYAEYFVHRTGHGLGMEAHEAPYLRWDNHVALEPGMVVSVEPAVYIPGLGGARHSDSVVVTESGHQVLTDFPRTPGALVRSAH